MIIKQLTSMTMQHVLNADKEWHRMEPLRCVVTYDWNSVASVIPSRRGVCTSRRDSITFDNYMETM